MKLGADFRTDICLPNIAQGGTGFLNKLKRLEALIDASVEGIGEDRRFLSW